MIEIKMQFEDAEEAMLVIKKLGQLELDFPLNFEVTTIPEGVITIPQRFIKRENLYFSDEFYMLGELENNVLFDLFRKQDNN